MSEIILKFAIILENTDESEFQKNYGPKFHRWLPDGKNDSIRLVTGHRDIDLEVWHERLGFVDSTFGTHKISFDYEQTDVDPVIMNKQGILQAGPLFGRLPYRNLSDSAMSVIRDSRKGDPEYIMIAKLLVTEIIYPLVEKMINVYRINFGQYWVRPFEAWDSRIDTLGAYCKHMNVMWSLDGGSSWFPFVPNEPKRTISISVEIESHCREYITKMDWKKIPELVHERESPTTAELFFCRACDHKNRGELRVALIDAVTSLELAIEEYLHRSPLFIKSFIHDMNTFWDMPLKSRMITLSIVIKKNTSDEIEQAVKAIDYRNVTIHEGQIPPDDANAKLSCLLNVITSFLPSTFYRFPSTRSGNTWAEEDGWNNVYSKYGFEPLDQN